MKKNIQRHINIKQERKLIKSINRGFTLIEILVVIGIIAVLASVVLVAINPARQFKMARDSQRVSNINAIMNSISQNIAEHKGDFFCGNTKFDIPNGPETIMNNPNTNTGLNLYPCLVPAYISYLPFDPSAEGAHFTTDVDYNTGYKVLKDVNGRVTVSAVGEITPVISVTR